MITEGDGELNGSILRRRELHHLNCYFCVSLTLFSLSVAADTIQSAPESEESSQVQSSSPLTEITMNRRQEHDEPATRDSEIQRKR